MQTSGNILFSEFRKAYIYNSIDGPVRCCKIDDETVRKEDGENDLPMPGETVVEDGEAVINGTTLQRPYSWYQINPNDSSFAPKNCDVFVIVVDTPYLMGSVDESTKDLCPESIDLGTNRVQDIQNFLTHIDDKEGQDAKMVVFVPLKCEKWAKEPNGLNKVTARIKEVYGTHIKNLSAYEKMNICVIPMHYHHPLGE